MDGSRVNNPLFTQFSDWLERLNLANNELQPKMLEEWRALISQIELHPEQLSTNHSQLVKTLARNSQTLVDALGRLNDGDSELETQLDKLRKELHQFNIQSLLHQAALPQQLAPLLFTQTDQLQSFNQEQLEKFEQLRGSLNSPQFAKLNQVIDAFIDWQQSGQSLLAELNTIVESATEQWLTQVDNDSEPSAQIALWGSIYDLAYRDRFEQPTMQMAQSNWLNHWADLKIAWRDMISQYSDQLGIPSPSQVDQLVEQLDAQRRRIRQLERKLEELSSKVASDE